MLWNIFSLYRSLKPLIYSGGMGLVLFFFSMLVGYLPVRDYFVNSGGYVEYIPSAILAAGLLLHVINQRFRELHNVAVRNWYLRKGRFL